MTTPAPTPAQPPAPPPDPGVSSRLDRIETTLSAITASLHTRAAEHTENKLDRPQTVAEQVDAALRQADKDRQSKAAQDATAKTLGDLAATVKELKETRPGPPVRGIETVMWGRR